MALVTPPLLREFILWIYIYVCVYTYIHVLEKPLLISPISNPIPKQGVRKMGWGVGEIGEFGQGLDFC